MSAAAGLEPGGDELPYGWCTKSLGSVIDFINGYAFKPDDWRGSGTPIIRIQNLNGSDAFNYFDGSIPERYHVEAGDLLFCWSGSRGTSFGARKWTGPLGYLNQHIFRCEMSRDLDDDFAFFLLESMTSAIEAEAHGGGGLVHIKKSEIVKFDTLLPPLDEQRRIAEVLRSVDETIAAAIDVIGQMRAARSHRLDAFMALPGSFRRIDEICRLSGGYGFPIKQQGKASGRYPFAKVSDMNRPGNEVQLRYSENYVDEADLRTLRAKPFPTGTIFFPKVGATLLTNKRRVAATEMLVDNNVMGAVATKVDPWFLYYALCTIDMADYVQPGAVPSVNQRTIGQIMIPVPEEAVQNEFVRSMRDLDTAIETQSDAIAKLAATKVAIAADLLSGRVRVPA